MIAGEVVVQDREWDKGLPCIISRYTNSIKKCNSESNWLLPRLHSINIFWESNVGNVGHINVIKMWFLSSNSFSFFPLCISLFSSFSEGFFSKHLHFLALTCLVSLCGKADAADSLEFNPHFAMCSVTLDKLFGFITLVSSCIERR